MKPSTTLPLATAFLFVLISNIGLSHAQSCSAEAKHRKDTCPDLVKPKGPASSEYKGDCELTEALYNISVTLTVSQQQTFNVFIQFLIDTVLTEVNLTEIEMVVQCSYALKHFFAENQDIYNKVAFLEIGSWGYCIDFQYVSVDLQADISQSVVTLDKNDDCELFDALLNGTAGNSQMQAAVIELIVELKVILKDSSLTYAQKMAKIHLQFELFFEVHPDWKSFFLSIEINGFGSLESLDDVCHGYDRALTAGSVLSGSSDSDCPFLGALTNATANSSFSITVRNQIKEFHDKIALYFSSTVDITLRLAYVSQQWYQMQLVEPWIVQAMMQISFTVNGQVWGTFYDLQWCSQFCKNSGSCGNLDNGLGTSPAPTTTVAPSTSKAPTTQTPHDCSTRGNLIAITAQNTTILTDVLTQNYNSWNSSIRLSFNTCFNQIRAAIWNPSGNFPTVAKKISEIVLDFGNYSKNNVNQQNIVMNIVISSWSGTIRDFCNCGSG